MSFLDNFGKGIGPAATGGGQQSLIGAVAQLISSPKIGGLGGLAQLFNKRGQGDTMASWVSTGENRSITPESVQDLLGRDGVQQVAHTAGVSDEEASHGISKVLPQLVDQLTPDGKLPEPNAANNTLSQLASRFLGRS